MKISRADNAVLNRQVPPDVERFVWESLVPRLIGEVKLSIVEVLLKERRALSPAKLRELAGLEDASLELVRYHAEYLSRRACVLEVVGEAPRPDGEGIEPTYYFPEPPSAARSASSAVSG
jgi:hypothetical protein